MGQAFLISWGITTLLGIIKIRQEKDYLPFCAQLLGSIIGAIIAMFIVSIIIGVIYGLICVFTTLTFSFAVLFLTSMIVTGCLELKAILNNAFDY